MHYEHTVRGRRVRPRRISRFRSARLFASDACNSRSTASSRRRTAPCFTSDAALASAADAARQGLTLVDWSAQRKHYLRATVQASTFWLDVSSFYGLCWEYLLESTSQAELRCGRLMWIQ